jgi:hypothetical protein
MRLKFLSLLVISLLLVPPVPLSSAQDLEPTASFTVTPSAAALGDILHFDGGDSVDHRGQDTNMKYRWNFDFASGGEFTSWSTSPTYVFDYTELGAKTVALEVEDSEGLTDRTFTTIQITLSAAFTAWFTVTPLEGKTDTEFEFRANVSSPGGQLQSEHEVRWDFEGDGVWDTDWSIGKIANNVYGRTGYFTGRLQVRVSGGDTITIIGHDQENFGEPALIFVTYSNYPMAAMNVSPTTGVTSTTFYFDATGSFDRQDGRDLDYRWDFDGDGRFEIDWGSETTPTHQFDLPGDYETMVQIRDSDDQIDQVIVNIEILTDNLAPTAKFTVTSDGPFTDKSYGTTGTTFIFNASGSTDEETHLGDLDFRWDFDGDRTWDTSWANSYTAEHQYFDLDSYIVRLQARDEDNRTDVTTIGVTVVENDAPTPRMTVSQLLGTPGTEFTFNASGSTDNQFESSQLEVRWDWEGDGEWDTAFSKTKIEKHMFERAGFYETQLQVMDPENAAAIIRQDIEVIPSTRPKATLTADASSGTFDTIFHFDGSDSSDGETLTEDLWYRWDTDYTGVNDILYDTSWSKSTTRSATFDEVGEQNVKFEVRDVDFDIGTAVFTVNIHWASQFMDILKGKGIIKGYTDGSGLAPDRQVSRAELLKMAMEAAELDYYKVSYDEYFTDVALHDWHMMYVERAKEIGITSGYSDGTFRPNESVNRAEAMKIILATFDVGLDDYRSGTFPDVGGGDWFASYVGTGHDLGLINGYPDGFFRPGNLMTRGEAAKIIALAMQGAL